MANPVVKHLKVSGKPAGPDPHRIYGSDWDDDHVIEGFDEAVAGAIPANIASQQDAEAGDDNTKIMTALRTKQQVDARLADEAVAEAGTDNAELMTPLRVNQSVNRRNNAVGIVDLTQPPYNLDLDSPDVDQVDIINQAFTDYEGSGSTLVIPASGSPTIGIGSSIVYKRGVTLQGGNGYGGNAQSDANFTGAVIQWLGGNNGVMVDWKGVNHSAFQGIKLDGNGATGMIGLHMWSENAPPQSYNTAKHFAIKRCFKSIVLSDPGDTSYAPDGTDPNNVGRAQNDSWEISDFVVFGDGAESSTGIHINGTNVAQSTEICRGNIQSVGYGIRVIQTNGNLRFKQINGGNPVHEKTFIRYEKSLAVHPVLDQCETEGTWTYAVHDSSTPYDDEGAFIYAPYTQLWINNQLNNSILIDGASRIVSITNSGGNPLSDDQKWVVGGTAYVWSFQDVSSFPDLVFSPWTTADSGQLSAIGDRAGIQGIYTGQVSAGPPPAYDVFQRGALSTAKSDGNGGFDASKIYFGDQVAADRYFTNIGPLAWMQGLGLAVGGGIPSGFMNPGEIASVTGTAAGYYFYGNDRNAYTYRSGNDVLLFVPTGGSFTAPSGKFATLEATSQLLVPNIGPSSAPAILNASTGIGLSFSSSTGVNFFASGVGYANFGPAGFNTFRNGNINAGIFGRTDNHGSGQSLVRLSFQGNDSTPTAVSYGYIEALAVDATPSATIGRLQFNVNVSGTPTNIAQVLNTGFNVASGTFQVGSVAVVDNARLIQLRSYTVATLPSASVAGKQIYVSNESGGATPAFSDGTNWRRVADRAVVS